MHVFGYCLRELAKASHHGCLLAYLYMLGYLEPANPSSYASPCQSSLGVRELDSMLVSAGVLWGRRMPTALCLRYLLSDTLYSYSCST